MRDALRAALYLRMREADQAAAAASARMHEILHKIRKQGDQVQDLELGRQLDEAARETERARWFADGVRATCEYLRVEVLEDSQPEPPRSPAEST